MNLSAVPMIETAANERVRSTLYEQLPSRLDDAQLMWLAGEGLAETLARQVLRDPQVNLQPSSDGRDRYRDQFWQMVVIEPGRGAFWVRK